MLTKALLRHFTFMLFIVRARFKLLVIIYVTTKLYFHAYTGDHLKQYYEFPMFISR